VFIKSRPTGLQTGGPFINRSGLQSVRNIYKSDILQTLKHIRKNIAYREVNVSTPSYRVSYELKMSTNVPNPRPHPIYFYCSVDVHVDLNTSI